MLGRDVKLVYLWRLRTLKDGEKWFGGTQQVGEGEIYR